MKTILLLCAFLLVSVAAFADDQSDGCGLGWKVTSRSSLFGTTTRGTTNMTLPRTFSMTSGTSGCDRHSFAQKKQDAVMFATVNQESLMIEMAQGKGEYLEGFARAFGCSDKASAAFAQLTQTHYQTVTAGGSANGVEMAEHVYNEIQKERALSAQCGS